MTFVRLAALGALTLLIISGSASAQNVEAEALFREGKQLIKDGKLAEACAKFDASDRLDPSAGTELNAADCHQRTNKLATAWATFLKAASNAARANEKQLEAEARRRAAVLAPKLSYLTISVPEGNRVDGLIIKRSGVVVDPAVWNTGVPVDGGEYEISGQAPGHEQWSTKVTLQPEGDKKSVEVPRFKQIEELAKKDPVLSGTETKPTEEPEPIDTPPPSTFTPMRKAAIGVAAVGVVALGGTIFFGLRANDLQSQAEDRCPMPACSDAMGVQLNKDANSAALFSNISLGVGVAAIGGAVALWFIGAPHETAPAANEEVSIVPVVGGSQAGFSLSGRF